MTKDQAIALSKSDWWMNKTPRKIAMFQLFEEKLCMPFGEFHKAVENALGRPVYSHEFAKMDALQKELMGDKPAPTMDEILGMIPEAKRIVIYAPRGDNVGSSG